MTIRAMVATATRGGTVGRKRRRHEPDAAGEPGDNFLAKRTCTILWLHDGGYGDYTNTNTNTPRWPLEPHTSYLFTTGNFVGKGSFTSAKV